MPRWFFAFVGLLVVLVGLQSCLSLVHSQPSAGGDSQGELFFEGRTRTYILHVPPSYTDQEPWPLVIFLHGGGGNAQGAASTYGVSAEVDQGRFIVVYPNGTGVLRDRVLTWNAGHCCGYALENRVNDVGFIRALIEKLQSQLNIDPKRIHATGHSNGAMMAYRLGAELSDVLAAIAPVAGTIGGRVSPASPLIIIPEPSEPVAVAAFHGKLDSHVLYDGGHGPSTSGERIDLSVNRSISFWVAANRCLPIPEREVSQSGNIIKETYSHCANNADVVLYTVVNGGHAWPGATRGERPTQEISATKLLWAFFEQHPKQ